MYRLILIAVLTFATAPAFAGQPEARETARINNCNPKKIDVYQNQLGSAGKVIYQVTCTLPKTTDTSASSAAPDTLLISCDQSLCELLRPMAADKK